MKIRRQLLVLDTIKKEDEEFFATKKDTAATFCAECQKNTSVGLYPYWHIYRRPLCGNCEEDYSKLLRQIEAVDT